MLLTRQAFIKKAIGSIVLGPSILKNEVEKNLLLSSDSSLLLVSSGVSYPSEEEIAASRRAHEEELNRIIQSLTRGNGQTITEYGDPLISHITGFPQTQPSGGAYFGSDGGYISYCPEGGLIQYVTLQFGVPFGNFTVGLNLGQAGSTVTYSYPVPSNSPGYYKLYIDKKFQSTPYVIKYKDDGEYPDWTIVYRGVNINYVSHWHTMYKVS